VTTDGEPVLGRVRRETPRHMHGSIVAIDGAAPFTAWDAALRRVVAEPGSIVTVRWDDGERQTADLSTIDIGGVDECEVCL
jgi:hypothetical protein